MTQLLSVHGGKDRPRPAAAILHTLNTFALDVMTIPSKEDLFWYVARNVAGRLGFIDCVIYEADAAETELRQAAALGEKNPYDRAIINPLTIPFGRGVTGRVAAGREPIIISDLLEDADYISDTQPARSEICVPLLANGRVLGVIDSEHPEPGVFGPGELEILTTVAAMTSAKLELLAEVERSAERYREVVRSHHQLAEEVGARRSLEAQLLEARKMEAVGRLTGGFAHSFNNILTAIGGNLDLAAMERVSNPGRESLDEAKAATARGASLIRDMLAFAQRMQLRPETVDLNRLVPEVCERAGMHLAPIRTDLGQHVLSVEIDPVAAEVALVNLMLNARDAMPDGGELWLRTRTVMHHLGQRKEPDLVPGAYVRLDVTDMGVGIDPKVRSRIFDPFFTTKPASKGTGLGLSMVKGFMEQSGGGIAASPAEPCGTTVSLFFPVADQTSA
ncbi:ATP-binding protein [Jannaschia sp.]|nr:ATP-binding protein [Jannaschia sp.]